MKIDTQDLPGHPCGWDMPKAIKIAPGFVEWDGQLHAIEELEGLARSLLEACHAAKQVPGAS